MSTATAPLVFDATADPAACALLRALARRPWDGAAWMALRDRAEELGCDAGRLGFFSHDFVGSEAAFRRQPRRTRRRLLRAFRQSLKSRFGDFEPQEIPF